MYYILDYLFAYQNELLNSFIDGVYTLVNK